MAACSISRCRTFIESSNKTFSEGVIDAHKNLNYDLFCEWYRKEERIRECGNTHGRERERRSSMKRCRKCLRLLFSDVIFVLSVQFLRSFIRFGSYFLTHRACQLCRFVRVLRPRRRRRRWYTCRRWAKTWQPRSNKTEFSAATSRYTSGTHRKRFTLWLPHTDWLHACLLANPVGSWCVKLKWGPLVVTFV